jgi:hypothetical protein
MIRIGMALVFAVFAGAALGGMATRLLLFPIASVGLARSHRSRRIDIVLIP